MARLKVGQVYKVADGDVFVISHLEELDGKKDVVKVHTIYDNGWVACYPVNRETGFDTFTLLGEYPNWQAAIRSILF